MIGREMSKREVIKDVVGMLLIATLAVVLALPVTELEYLGVVFRFGNNSQQQRGDGGGH